MTDLQRPHPIAGIAGCCPRAASGHATAVPPNTRRLSLVTRGKTTLAQLALSGFFTFTQLLQLRKVPPLRYAQNWIRGLSCRILPSKKYDTCSVLIRVAIVLILPETSSLIRAFRVPGKAGGGLDMRLAHQVVCGRCRHKIQMVATLEPYRRDPGLVAFVCAECDAADSILVCPVNRTRDSSRSHKQRRERHGYEAC